MGTGFDRDISENMEGIIPRAVRHLFSGIENIQVCLIFILKLILLYMEFYFN